MLLDESSSLYRIDGVDEIGIGNVMLPMLSSLENYLHYSSSSELSSLSLSLLSSPSLELFCASSLTS